MPNSDTPLSTAEAAARSGQPKRTVIHAISTGKLPAQKLGGYNGPYLIQAADLDAWAAVRDAKASA